MRPLLALHQAGVHYGPARRGVRALHGLNLTLHSGERVALVGANGSGKSTLLRLLHGLAAPSTGRVEQAAALRCAMLVQGNVELGLWLAGTPWRLAQRQALQALQRVELESLAGRNARSLSGGQQQRVALARAWALAPQLLLLDEPTASLDPHAKREVEGLIERLATEHADTTLVFASHNLGQVKRLASRVLYLEQGRLLADLPVAEFFGGPLLQAQYPAAYAFVKGEWV